MSRGLELTPGPAQPERRAEFEAPPDRELRSPSYRWLMHVGLPVGLSVIVHLLLFGLMGLKTWDVLAQREAEVGEYEAGLVERVDERIDAAFDWSEQVTLDAPEVTPLEEFSFTDFSRVGTLEPSALDAAASGAGIGDAGAGDLGIGGGRLSLLGTGSGAGAVGTGGLGSGLGGRGRQGQAGIWNVRVRADKVVYVVDFSGSIIVAVDELRRELKRSIGRLAPAQSFNVIVFYSESTGGRERYQSEAFSPQLRPATEDARREVFDWLERKSPNGRTEPLQSMKRALALGPQVVFFFSDGYFEDSVVEEITHANRAAQAKIVCLVFDEILLQDTSRLPRETDGARRLREIAEQNGGKVKIVTGRDLQR